MVGYSMGQMVRANAHKLDWPFRETVLQLFKSFKWTPCFLHKFFETKLQNRNIMSVFIEFEEGCDETGFKMAGEVLQKEKRRKLKNRFNKINCWSAGFTPSALHSLFFECRNIRKVYLNREVKGFLDTGPEARHAKEVVRNGQTRTGKGVTGAVVDTGFYPHLDLEGRIMGFAEMVNQNTEPYDERGHGTQFAGDVARRGPSSFGKYRGPGREAYLIGVKVFNKRGSGRLADFIEGVEGCIQYNEDNPDEAIDFMSMLLGGDALRYEHEQEDPLVRAVEEAWSAGIVVCVAAGNSGPDWQTIGRPGGSEKVITVGALDDNNTASTFLDEETVASFSSRGPTVYGKEKPDFLGPGVNIFPLRSGNSYFGKLQKSSRVGSQYFSMSGTSMATPICAGIAALILQQNPDLTPDEVTVAKELLKNGTEKWKDEDPNIYGAGAVNAEISVPGGTQ
uniref:Alkaline protease n=1 Tax=Bacillus subtilis TaxID=1423 RepID=A0A023IMJ8_BACIU|nr:alkaline protease [Bacillus subtilis]